MNQREKETLFEFAKKVAELDISVNCNFSTKNYDYEIVTYVDEIQILDSEENIVVSVEVKKDN